MGKLKEKEQEYDVYNGEYEKKMDCIEHGGVHFQTRDREVGELMHPVFREDAAQDDD